MNNKAHFKLLENWVEVVAAILLVIGFILAISSRSAVISYFVIFCSGTMLGRWWVRYKKQGVRLPIIIISIGFLIGFLLGSFYGDRRVMIILFIIGIVGTYYLHTKGKIKSMEW